MTEAEVREAATEALDALPRWVRDELGEVAVIVEESHPDGIMGIYDPVGGLNRIVVFRDANPNADEVRKTVWHEVGHYIGMGEEQLEGLGYALSWEPVIGLEIHVQLSTRTKMFCGCELSFGDEPNMHTCQVCLAHPGALPAPTSGRSPTRCGSRSRSAARSPRARSSHRKNYFYPDIPKGYQISQYDDPLATGGRLGDVRIHRVHLEEDAAKLIHVGESGRIHGSGASLVDFNRGGTRWSRSSPSPTSTTRRAAREWLALLRTTIKQIGASDVNMEEGSLRCDANVSLRPAGSRRARDQDRAQEHEQLPLHRARGRRRGRAPDRVARRRASEVTQETLHFDPRSGSLDPAALEGVRARLPLLPRAGPRPAGSDRGDDREAPRGSLPELPAERRERYLSELGLTEKQATQLAFDAELARVLRARAGDADEADARVLANWVTGELAAAPARGGRRRASPAGSRVDARGDRQARRDGRAQGDLDRRRARCSRRSSRRAGDPAEIAEREGLGRDRGRGRAGGDRRARARGRARGAAERSATAT